MPSDGNGKCRKPLPEARARKRKKEKDKKDKKDKKKDSSRRSYRVDLVPRLMLP
jgi:hypothetical protein